MQANRKIIGSLLVLLVAACLTAGSASAQGVGGGLGLDTPGTGLELEPLVTERFGIRGLATGGSVLHEWDESGTRYDGKSPFGTGFFGTGFLLADWHPYARVSDSPAGLRIATSASREPRGSAPGRLTAVALLIRRRRSVRWTGA